MEKHAHSVGPLNGPVSSGLTSPHPHPQSHWKTLSQEQKNVLRWEEPQGTRRGGAGEEGRGWGGGKGKEGGKGGFEGLEGHLLEGGWR